MTENEKLDLIISEMQKVKEDVRNLKGDMQEVREDVRNLKGDMQEVREDVRNLKGDMQEVREDVRNLKDGMKTVDRKITDIHLILENEIRVNIQRVAEGHLDLSRSLHDAMKPSNEVEMLAIKVRMLESDMREVKARVL